MQVIFQICLSGWDALSVPALLVVGIVGAIGDDDVVHELDAHEVACLSDASGQVVVGTAGAKTA